MSPAVRVRIAVRGVVQGVGFRPFLARLAAELQLGGEVRNELGGVSVEVEGAAELVAEFERRISTDAPPLARVLQVTSKAIEPCGGRGFVIEASQHGTGERTLVSPDVATCEACLSELNDPEDRRYRHPFITCTDCGPRFTIIEDLPYDRPATTMRDFTMCPACASEYADPQHRRYHAQPIGCHDCGPTLSWRTEAGEVTGTEEVLARAVAALRAGQIVAIKGVGGFHLACSATDSNAVARLRELKRRPGKPFALMAADLLTAAGIVDLDPTAADLLTSPQRPIVLLPRRADGPELIGVAPGLTELGVLLPYTPLHSLLLAEVGLLVMTSGNLSDEPLCFDNEDAWQRLGGIADGFVLHDRRIAVPCEDSVVTVVDGHEVPIRRSRGYAPLPVLLPTTGPAADVASVLAVGAEVKNTFVLTRGDLAFCSAHLGDMGSVESQQAFARSVAHAQALHGVQPRLLIADDHPGYATRAWAERASQDRGIELVTVQHHHAHLASLLAEHQATEVPALGITFDGTGYGCDATVWGGEILYVDGDIAHANRVGHLEPFALPGGEKAVREPWRIAVSLLSLAGMADHGLAPAEAYWGLSFADQVTAEAVRAVESMVAAGHGVTTSSAGRLFDGVAALLGIRTEVNYEAQAAIELEHLATTATEAHRLPLPHDGAQIYLGELIRNLVAALRDGIAASSLALGFHQALAQATTEVALTQATRLGVGVVGLTGGVMQNRLLVQQLRAGLETAGLTVLTHRVVPPNDGGLSLGQAVVGLARLRGSTEHHIHQLSGREGEN